MKTTNRVGIRTCSDYSPFGVELDGRTVRGGYRYGFQNQEKDDEVKGVGNSVNYLFRMHDPRLGRFFKQDPISSKYPELSTYQFGCNNVIWFYENKGLEGSPPGWSEKYGSKRPAVGTFYASTKVQPFNAPNGLLLSGTENDGFFDDSKLAAVGWVYSDDVSDTWIAIAFETKSGAKYTWDDEKQWYINEDGEEFDDGLSYDITNMVGGSVAPVIQAFIDKNEKNDSFYSFKKAWDAHGGNLANLIWDGFKQTVSEIANGGHKGSIAFGNFYSCFLMSGGIITGQSPLLLYNGTTRGTSKTILKMPTIGGAFGKINYYTGIAMDLGYSTELMGIRAPSGIFTQMSHNAYRISAGRVPAILYSNSMATMIGRQWQNQSIGMGLGLGGFGTLTSFGGVTIYTPTPSLTFGQ